MIIGVEQSGAGFQERWPEFIEKCGGTVRMLNLRAPDWRQQVLGCDGVMWHWYHDPDHKQSARVILHTIETEMGIPVFPNLRTGWHFDDKIAQTYMLEALDLPRPGTWVFWDREQAMNWASDARYPLVAKLSSGAGSSNVQLLRHPGDARSWILRMFSRGGVLPLPACPRGTGFARRASGVVSRWAGRVLSVPAYVFLNRPTPLPRQYWQPHKNYAYFQEYLPDNACDTRVTVIGNRAFGYRRMNRPGDFRASGSGNFDVTPEQIDPRCVQLAFAAAAKINAQSVAFDFLCRGPERAPVIVEFSYGYVSWMIESCPGHWDREMTWRPGRMWPEEAHVLDLVKGLSR